MNLPETMTAVEISMPGGPKVLKPVTRPVPVARQGQILIKVVGAGVNRPDTLQRAGKYAPPANASDLPGLECSGTVVAIGPGVTRWAVGDPVCALLPGGGYAEFVVTNQDHALRIPNDMSMVEAAALCETYFTVYSNVFMRGGLQAGESFLIHGGSSGIGTTAIQLAKAAGVRVFVTAGNAEKCAKCEELGAEKAINYREEKFENVVRDLTGGAGVNLILDMVGGSYIPRNIEALALDGRLVQIAFLEASVVELNFAMLMVKRLTMTGSTLRPQSDLAKAKIAEKLRENVWPLLDSGAVKPIMDSNFALEDAADAHALMESSAHIGKIVLTVS